MVQSKTTSPKNVLHELGYKIFLDRYAQKDMTRATLAVGDTVIVVVDAKTGQREIGKVTALDLPKVQVQLLDGETVERDVEHVDKPLETDPGQMMDRVAAGIASVESTPELQKLWTERFRWLLDDWKFVPAGRILAAAGTDQELTYYNCMPPDQELLTADGYKPIGDVKVGDLVVTHRSRLRPVLHKFERETDEPLYIIRPKKIGFDDLRVTGDHKIYIIRSEWVNKHKSRDGLRLKQEPDWIPAKDIRPGDYVAVGFSEASVFEPVYASPRREVYPAAFAPSAHPAQLSGAAVPVIEKSPDELVEYDGLQWSPVDEIAVEDYSGVVMDIEVAEDHSFISAGVVVSNCYVIPSPRDSRGGIIETLRQMTEIMSRGGGVGINVSSLRPRHAYVKGVNGRSSGAVSWGGLYSFVTGLIEQGGCFGPQERIATHLGLIPARELADRIEAGETLFAHTHRGLRRITARFRNGVKPLYELKTARGYTVRITEDHKVAVLMDGQITTMPLKYLQPGDEILLLLGEGMQGDYVRLSPVQYERSVFSTTLNENVRLPETLDEDLAYLVGYMYGDGYVHSGKKVNWHAPKAIKMATADAYPEIRRRIIETTQRVFGITPTVDDREEASANVSLYSRLVVEWLAQNDLLKAKADLIRVPEAIFRSPSPVQAAFIAGYFDADGCNRGRKGGYGMDSISRAMLEDVQKLLALNGIVSRIIATDRSAQGWRTIYRLTVTGSEFKKRFAAFVPGEKVSAENNGTREMYNTYPAGVWSALNARAKYRQRIYDGVSERISYGQMTHIRQRLEADGQSATVEQVDDLLRTLPDTIVSITPVGESDTYDFEVEDVHLLSGNGVYTSNSRRGALMLILDDWHPDVFDFINSKRKAGQITNANISVGVSDKLMEAVKADGDWTLMFPDTSEPGYDEEWDGSLEKWMAAGRKVIHYRTVKARAVWDAIIESAWASAEPGVFFRERYNKMSNSWYFAPIISTNPCVTGDTPVATETGYVKARDLQPGVKIRTPGGLKPIAKVYNNGMQRIYRVDFSDGGELECTADHKLKVVRGKKYEWVATSELREGDKVLVSPNEAFGSRRRLPEEAVNYIRKRQLKTPDYYDRTTGFLVGVVIGDGTLRQLPSGNSYANQCKVAFGINEAEWMERFQGLLAGIGIHTHVARSSKNIALPNGAVALHQSVRLECYKLATLMIKIGMTPNVKAPQKVIPQHFMTLDRDFLAGVLDGLFSTDGNVLMKQDNPMLRFSTSSHELARQVRLLLLQFGIHGRIYATKREETLEYDRRSMYGTGTKYDVVVMNEGIPRFYSQIGLSHPQKAARLKEIAENWHYLGGTWTAAVVSVQDTKREEEVFDVYEPDTLTWITNGYVSLDCGEQGLPSFGVCNLGAINLARFYDEEKHDVKWDELEQTARFATRFLDNVIDNTPYFFEPNRQQQMSERRVGLNNMGLAELLIRLGIRYGSDESVQFIDKLYGFLARVVYETSTELAQEKGAFPKFDAKKFLQSGFMKSMPRDIRDKVKKRGIRNVTLLTQAPTGCVAPDTLVSTAAGLRPIIELGDADGEQWQIITQDVHTDEGLRKTSHFYINGYAPVKTMTTRRGFSLTATHNHRIRIIDADGNYVWRRMDELVVGDRVVLKKNTLGDGETVRLASVEQGNRALSDLPPVLTPELAELLGLYMGDGYTKRRGGLHIVVCKRDPDLLTHVQSLMKKVWGEDRQVSIEDRQGCWVANLTGYYIPRFFEANGFSKPQGNHGEGAEGAFIPSKILQAGKTYVAAFLRGLFEADGGVHRGTISLVSTSKRLLNQVQVALLGLGIVATIREIPRSTGSLGQRAKYELRILNRREGEKFAREIGFISQRKRDLAANLGNIADRGDSIAVPALCEEFYAKSKGLKNEVRQQIIGLVSNGALSQQFVKQTMTAYPTLQETRLGQLVAKDIFIDDVAAVEDGACLTYDLSVPDNQTYIANGFVSHNTTGTMVNTSTGIEPFFSWVYYRKSRLGLHEEQVPLVKEWFEAHPDETDLPDYFVTAMDLTPEEHVKVQGAIQRWVDSSISKCVVGDTLVLTDEGLQPIEDLSELREPDTFADLDVTVRTSGGHSRATAFYYNGMRPTLRLSLAYGFEIEGTYNHPIRVLDADGTSVFKPLSALHIGDIVPLYMGQRQFGRPGKPLPAYQGRWNVTNTKPIHIPAQMSEELAYLLGCITSEGTIGRNGVGFVNSDRQIVERVAGLFESLFNIKCRIERDNRRDSLYYVRANSRALRSWLVDELGMLPGAKNKTIPSCILGASAGEIGHFLRGLFLDAYMTLDGKMFGIGLASRKLLKQLQVLLLNFGIVARMHKAGANAWSVTVAGSDLGRLAAITAFDEVWKNERIARRDDGRQMKARSYSTLLPEQVSGELHQAVQKNERSLRSLYPDRAGDYQRVRVALMRSTKIRRQDAYEVYQAFEDTSSDYLKQFFAHDKEGCIYLEVKAIQSGFAEVFDITVPDGHEFIANGICNHNTANLPNNYTIEQTRALYEYMYELGCKGGTVYRDGSRDEQVLMLKEETTKQGDKKADEARPVEQVATPHRVYPRPRQLAGVTVSRKTPFGTAFITMNSDEHGNPFEVFITVGKAGSDLQADAEGLGRMISLQLRTTAPQNRKEMLKLVIDQLQGIGGSRSVGMGPSRVMSLPDAVAGALMEHYFPQSPAQQLNLPLINGSPAVGEPKPEPDPHSNGIPAHGIISGADICPDCGLATLVRAEGCEKCLSCGYSRC